MKFDSVIRSEIPADDDVAQGSTLAVLEGREDYTANASNTQVTCALILDFAVNTGPKEEAATVVNNTTADLIKALCSDRRLTEGGTGSGGAPLTMDIRATGAEPNPYAPSEQARGTVEFLVTYRIRNNDLFKGA
ncbi:hypothetical protein [Jannaschia sp. 2305UL9-9]|uniref:hypothetical protein n=1 Tax=Jannaschia sp. 2305UL9-9 TaxID=3121638 RepID=UPI003528945F